MLSEILVKTFKVWQAKETEATQPKMIYGYLGWQTLGVKPIKIWNLNKYKLNLDKW